MVDESNLKELASDLRQLESTEDVEIDEEEEKVRVDWSDTTNPSELKELQDKWTEIRVFKFGKY